MNTNSQKTVKSEIESIQKLFIDTEIVKITLAGGIEYRLTPWHPVYLLKNRHHNLYDVIRKRADEVTTEDFFIYGNGQQLNDVHIGHHATKICLRQLCS